MAQERITDIIAGRFSVSVEVFPPRNGTSPNHILGKLAALKRLRPDFVSVTKGAGGSMRGGTVPIGYMIAERYGLTPLVHFRSRDLTMRETENLLVDHKYFEITNILAVMGDPVAGDPPRPPAGKGRNKYASDLVRQIAGMNKGQYLPMPGDNCARRSGEPSTFCIGVAGYPERPWAEERRVMGAKSKAGADFAITQMFFTPQLYEKYLRRLRAADIRIPVIPGVRPLSRAEHVQAAEKTFGASVPPALKKALKGAGDTEGEEICLSFTVDLCRRLAEMDAPGVHLFILNDVEMARSIIGRLRKEL
ncbi:MAG: methylenetetrahydrofolate reductase [Euryarchaeota archaeon]|nr:methylenetetrahydrofolate reductase [Euryarchaeota archaeon]